MKSANKNRAVVLAALLAASAAVPVFAAGVVSEPYIPAGVAVGIEDNVPALAKQIQHMVDATSFNLSRMQTTPVRPGTADRSIVINQNIESVPQTPVQLAAATAAYFEQARWII